MRKIERIIGIYKITSPSGKVYIGSSKHIYNRWKRYEKLLCEKQPRIYKSLLKHEVKNHIFEIIEKCEFENLYDRERYWQEFYNVTGKNGLNCHLVCSNDRPREASEETKAKMSISLKGKIHSDESRKKLSDAHIGKILSEEHKEKLSKSHKGKKLTQKHKKSLSIALLNAERNIYSYIQRNFEGKIIAFYRTKADVIAKGYSYNSVNRHCRGERKTYKESIWERIPYKKQKNE